MWFWYALAGVGCWGLINVLGSVLLHQHESRISVLGWHLSSVSAVFLLLMAVFLPIPRQEVPLLLFAGVTSYIADYYYYHVLKQIDVSLSNLAWAILSIFLMILGVFVFKETWHATQLLGVLCVLAAVALLVGKSALLDARAVAKIVLLALSYVPLYAIQKHAVMQHDAWLGILFWPMLARESCFLVLPLFRSSSRRAILETYSTQPPQFFIGAVATITLFFGASICSVLSYSGPLFVVSVIGNAQPFMVLLLATLLVQYFPKIAPREQAGWAEIRAKALAFIIVFVGLAFIALNQ